MIKAAHLSKRYGSKMALYDASFSIGNGEVVGFLGPNGAGKSTTMNLLCGYLEPTWGQVEIAGMDMALHPLEARRHIGYLPEIPPLYMDMTVAEQLLFACDLRDLPQRGAVRRAYIDSLCRRTELLDVRDRLIRNLSKGYRQRVGIAQALIGRPRVLVLDEPTSGLDPKQMVEVRDLVRGLGKEHTVIFSSHNLAEVQAVCDRVVVIDRGRVVADGAPEELARRLGGGGLRVCVEGPESAVRGKLERLPGVKALRALPGQAEGCCAFAVMAEEGRDIRREVARALKEGPHLALEISSVDLPLENIFLRLTEPSAEGRGEE